MLQRFGLPMQPGDTGFLLYGRCERGDRGMLRALRYIRRDRKLSIADAVHISRRPCNEQGLLRLSKSSVYRKQILRKERKKTME